MNWTRVVLAGIAAGIVMNLTGFVTHGLIMTSTYARYTPQVFTATAPNPAWFGLIAVCTGLGLAMLFSRTRGSWAPGWQGGLTFGFFAGLVAFFLPFYNPLVIDGFPYFLAWCGAGITMIENLLAGVVLGAVIRRS